MPRSKPWLKMWVEWIADPKMDSLSLSEQGAWWRLVSLAHQCAHDGALTVGGSSLSLDEIMKTLKITDEGDKRDFNKMIEKMKSRASLHWNLNTLIVTHYKDRQEMNPSNTKEAVAQRQREHRLRERMSQEQRDNEPDIPSPPQDIEKDIEGEGEFVTLSRKSSDSQLMAKLSRLYEEYIGLLTPPAADQLREFTENYKGKIEWLHKAFEAAGKKRRWPYIAAILQRYQEEGGPHADRRERGDEGEQPGAHQRDIIKEARAGGWEVLGDDEPEPTEAGDQD